MSINIRSGAQVEIAELNTNTWVQVPNNDLSFQNISNCIEQNLKKSIFATNLYQVRATVGKYSTNVVEIPPYYHQEQ